MVIVAVDALQNGVVPEVQGGELVAVAVEPLQVLKVLDTCQRADAQVRDTQELAAADGLPLRVGDDVGILRALPGKYQDGVRHIGAEGVVRENGGEGGIRGGQDPGKDLAAVAAGGLGPAGGVLRGLDEDGLRLAVMAHADGVDIGPVDQLLSGLIQEALIAEGALPVLSAAAGLGAGGCVDGDLREGVLVGDQQEHVHGLPFARAVGVDDLIGESILGIGDDAGRRVQIAAIQHGDPVRIAAVQDLVQVKGVGAVGLLHRGLVCADKALGGAAQGAEGVARDVQGAQQIVAAENALQDRVGAEVQLRQAVILAAQIGELGVFADIQLRQSVAAAVEEAESGILTDIQLCQGVIIAAEGFEDGIGAEVQTCQLVPRAVKDPKTGELGDI